MSDLSDARLVQIAKVLSDKTRLRIVMEISKRGNVSCSEASEFADLSQPTISHHVKLLLKSGVVHAQKDGRHSILSINKAVLAEFKGVIEQILK